MTINAKQIIANHLSSGKVIGGSVVSNEDCAFDAEKSDVEVAVTETILEEVEAADTDLDYKQSALGEMKEIVASLEEFRSELKAVQGNNTMSAAAARFLHLGVAQQLKRLPVGLNGPVASLESFEQNPTLAGQVSLESLSDLIEKIWEGIKRAYRTVRDAVINFVHKLFSLNSAAKRKAQANSKEILLLPDLSETAISDPSLVYNLSRPSARALWDIEKKSVTTDLAGDVERFRAMFVEGFKPFVIASAQRAKIATGILKAAIPRVEEALRAGQDEDTVIDTMTPEINKELQAAFEDHSRELGHILERLKGTYLGGLVIGETEWDKLSFSVVKYETGNAGRMIPLSKSVLSAANESSYRLLMAIEIVKEDYDVFSKESNASIDEIEAIVARFEKLNSKKRSVSNWLSNTIVAVVEDYNHTLTVIGNVNRVASALANAVVVEIYQKNKALMEEQGTK